MSVIGLPQILAELQAAAISTTIELYCFKSESSNGTLLQIKIIYVLASILPALSLINHMILSLIMDQFRRPENDLVRY
jgi:hypothetical protein